MGHYGVSGVRAIGVQGVSVPVFDDTGAVKIVKG
jgi:hypothetical protein